MREERAEEREEPRAVERREAETRVERETRGESQRERHVVRERERASREREREHAHKRVRRGGVCLLYRGTRRCEKEWGSRVTSCHSALPSTIIIFLNSLSIKKIICFKKFNFRFNIFQHFNIFVNIPNIQHFSTFFNMFDQFCLFWNTFSVNFQQLLTFKEISIRNWYNLDFLIQFNLNLYI